MRGRCQRCLRAGDLVTVSDFLRSGQRLCEHCALHLDTPAMNCEQCFPKLPSRDEKRAA